MKVKLIKLRSKHERLRTLTVEGVTARPPTKGNKFLMFAEGLVRGIRVVETSIVNNVSMINDDYLFDTQYSSYRLEVLDEKESGDGN